MPGSSGAVDLNISDDDFSACRNLIKGGSKSFYAASLLLPEAVRLPSYALYAFCRVADDVVDDVQANQAVLDRLRLRLDRVYQGVPDDHPADRAFARVIETFAIPKALPLALLEGFEWDLGGRTYETIEEVRAYAARVAGTVGVMMTLIMGRRDPMTLARSCDLGVAMQLTNIARDVGEDARAGRVYLPEVWLASNGLSRQSLIERPEPSASLSKVVAHLLDEAETLYNRANPGVGQLPRACRPAIQAARLIYREIGREVARRGFDSVSDRAVVSMHRKQVLAAYAYASSYVSAQDSKVPALPETRFLIESIHHQVEFARILPKDYIYMHRRNQERRPFGLFDMDKIIEIMTEMELRDRQTKSSKLSIQR